MVKILSANTKQVFVYFFCQNGSIFNLAKKLNLRKLQKFLWL